MTPSVWQLLLVLLIILLLFGASKLPKISEDLAKSIRKFKSNMKEEEDSETTKSTESADKQDSVK